MVDGDFSDDSGIKYFDWQDDWLEGTRIDTGLVVDKWSKMASGRNLNEVVTGDELDNGIVTGAAGKN